MSETGNDVPFIPGALDIPPPGRIRRLRLAATDGASMPHSFVVSALNHWFDPEWDAVPDRVHTAPDGTPFDQYQGGLDDCVGRSARLVKTAHEGTAMSARDAWNLAKRIDAAWGHPMSAYGTSCWAGIEALEGGIAEERLVPSDPGPRGQYLDMESYLSADVERSRAAHRGAGRPFYVPRDEIASTTFATDRPCVTSLEWYESDNATDRRLGRPSGRRLGGHAVACCGQIRGEALMVTFSKRFAWHGMFLVPAERMARFGNGYFHVDEAIGDLSDLIEAYDGRDLRLAGTGDHYRCDGGTLRKYPDEIAWWCHGRLFGYDTGVIPRQHFDALPHGEDIGIDEAPWEMRELVRQIRQSCGLE